jgi:hypothetical protein
VVLLQKNADGLRSQSDYLSVLASALWIFFFGSMLNIAVFALKKNWKGRSRIIGASVFGFLCLMLAGGGVLTTTYLPPAVVKEKENVSQPTLGNRAKTDRQVPSGPPKSDPSSSPPASTTVPIDNDASTKPDPVSKTMPIDKDTANKIDKDPGTKSDPSSKTVPVDDAGTKADPASKIIPIDKDTATKIDKDAGTKPDPALKKGKDSP